MHYPNLKREKYNDLDKNLIISNMRKITNELIENGECKEVN